MRAFPFRKKNRVGVWRPKKNLWRIINNPQYRAWLDTTLARGAKMKKIVERYAKIRRKKSLRSTAMSCESYRTRFGNKPTKP